MSLTERRECPLPSHFYSLDALRGLAAISAVLWHWAHFFEDDKGAFEVSLQPFYWMLQPLYHGGYLAVQLFFCLSGFIFYWLYADRIATRSVSLREFCALRFSRLYPLHLATLLFVGAVQTYLYHREGRYFVYVNNDLYHFILQLLFASNWGLERGPSFNGPIWSVSVEVLLYAVFFLACFYKWNRSRYLMILACAGLIVNVTHFKQVGVGVLCFFTGCLTFQAFRLIQRRGISQAILIGFLMTTFALWLIIPWAIADEWLYHAYLKCLGDESRSPFGTNLLKFAIQKAETLTFCAVLFPLTLISLSLCESYRGTLGKRVAFLGDVSYSTYLLHFPLQLVFIVATLMLGVPATFFYSNLSLVLFFAILLPLSFLSYWRFERPCQSLLRKTLLTRRRATGDR